MAYDPRADVQQIMDVANSKRTDPATRLAIFTTLSRYQDQLKQLQNIKKVIAEQGEMLTQRDKFGRRIQVENPAMRSYAKVCQQANDTAVTLSKLGQATRCN